MLAKMSKDTQIQFSMYLTLMLEVFAFQQERKGFLQSQGEGMLKGMVKNLTKS
jgi:hypothetical protein